MPTLYWGPWLAKIRRGGPAGLDVLVIWVIIVKGVCLRLLSLLSLDCKFNVLILFIWKKLTVQSVKLWLRSAEFFLIDESKFLRGNKMVAT